MKPKQTGAYYIAKKQGSMNNKYADNIVITGKQSKLIRVSQNVVKRSPK